MLDSLLKQNTAVLASTILAALLVSLVLIFGLVVRPQIERSAADTAQTIRSLELSFAQMDPLQQILFAEALRASEMPDVLVADDAPMDAGVRRSWFANHFLRVLSRQHGIASPDVRIDRDGRVWLRVVTADRPYWLSIRTLPAMDPVAGLALASAIAMLAALAGGIALQIRVARPLKRLESTLNAMPHPAEPQAGTVRGPREIAALSRALGEMTERLRDAEVGRAQMLAGVSHDLRTPLTKLRLALAMMGSADAELVAGAERDVVRIESMLGQFLDFARGFEVEEQRDVALRALLRDVVERIDPSGAIALDAPDGVLVRVRPGAISRAVGNLLENALRYGAQPIALIASLRDGQLVIDVADAGRGIPPEDEASFLRPFVRGNGARSSEGTGLGLSIVDQVVRAHGGHLEFERSSNRFTARLRLPQPAGDDRAPGSVAPAHGT